MPQDDINLDNINLSIISRINDSVDLSDADKKILIKLVMVRNKGSTDVTKIKEHARKEAIEEYKKEHKDFIDRTKQEIVEDIIRMIQNEAAQVDDFFNTHQIDAREIINKIREKYLK